MCVYLHKQHKNITSDLYIQMCLGEAVQKWKLIITSKLYNHVVKI